ncbi:putative reverse transcriptase domain-containing protein [Tanacetum coccineum]
MASQGAGRISCPLQGREGCSGGNGKGLTKKYFIDHLGTRHFKTNDLKVSYKDRFASDFSLFCALDSTLHQAGIWLCGECFCTHTFSKNCKHANGVVVPAPSFEEVAIFGIHVPPRPDLSVVGCTSTGTIPTNEAVVDGAVSQVHSLGVESICFDINLLSRVFSKKMRTVKCIPPRLRLGFAKIFCSALDNVLVNPGDLSVWVQLLILPCCVLSTFVPTNRAQRRSGERERCQFECISRAILRWRDPVDRLRLVSDRLAELTPSFSGVKKSNKHDEANVVQCKRKLGDGHFTAAIKVLTSSGVAPSTPDTMHELEAKHPYAPPLTLSSSPLGVDALSVNKDLVLNRIRGFSKGTSCGRDGLRAQHLMDILGGAASAVADDLLGSITGVPGGGIRPIVVGTVWRRLVSKVASSSIGNSMNTYLQDFQFGVGVPGGCEAVLHSVNRLIESKGNEVGLSMLLVDFKNAFNLVDMSVLLEETRVRCPSIAPWVEFCYARPARLYYDDSVLWSCQGVQQGDPLGPLLFALALHPLVQTINQSCELTLQAWYLDDGTIVGDTLMVSKELDIIKNDGPARVSLDEGFCRDLALKRVSKTISLMEAIHKLHDPQCELLLLRNCAGVEKLSYALRTCSTLYLLEAQVQFDHALRASLEKVVTALGLGFGDWQWRLATLPIKLGGLGILSAGDIIQYAFLASRLQSSTLQTKILMKTGIESQGSSFKHALDVFNTICNLDVLSVTTCTSAPHMMKTLAKCYFCVIEKDLASKYTLSPRQVSIRNCIRAPHAQDFLFTIPIDGLGQRMNHRQFRYVLCYRLTIPMFSEGKDAYLDVTCISPFAGMGATSCAPGVALHNAVEKKKKKYGSVCEENGYKFIPFAFSTFGEFDTDALDTLSRIKSISISHSNNAKSGVFIFHRVSFCIQKGVGAQLVFRLPSNFM